MDKPIMLDGTPEQQRKSMEEWLKDVVLPELTPEEQAEEDAFFTEFEERYKAEHPDLYDEDGNFVGPHKASES